MNEIRSFVDRNKSILTMLAPTMYQFKEHDGGIYMTDNNGFVATREEMIKFIGELQDAVSLTDEDAIKKINCHVHEKMSGEYASKASSIPKRKITSGFVYILNAGNGLFKIGKTIDVDKRMDTFTVQLPFKLELVHTIETNDHTRLERELHEQYADKRHNGEWFELNAHDIDDLTNIKNSTYDEVGVR